MQQVMEEKASLAAGRRRRRLEPDSGEGGEREIERQRGRGRRSDGGGSVVASSVRRQAGEIRQWWSGDGIGYEEGALAEVRVGRLRWLGLGEEER